MSQPDQITMLEGMLTQLAAFVAGMKSTAPKEVSEAGDELVASANKFVAALKAQRDKVAA